jgi:hypothetical protein
MAILSLTRGQGRPARQPVSNDGPNNQQIDAAVALMMVIGRAMVEDENEAGFNWFLSNPTHSDAPPSASGELGGRDTRGALNAPTPW